MPYAHFWQQPYCALTWSTVRLCVKTPGLISKLSYMVGRVKGKQAVTKTAYRQWGKATAGELTMHNLGFGSGIGQGSGGGEVGDSLACIALDGF